MHVSFSRLFEPINIGKSIINNRIAMAPMVIMGMTNRDGSPTQRAIDFYIERVRGGVGLIITSIFKVENKIDTAIESFPMITKAALPPFSELCDVAHSWGTKIFVQLSVGLGRVAAPYFVSGKPVSASAILYYWDPNITCRPLTTGEVESLVKAFGDAAEMVASAEVDGIEVHGHEGYLLDQFTTAIWNQRADKYGGDLKSRMTLPIEILREVKKRVGSDFPMIYRYSLKHFMKGLNSGALRDEIYEEAGRDVEEGIKMAKLLEEAGYDALHVDAGCYDAVYWAHPPLYLEHGCLVDLAAKVKRVVKIPVITVGRLEIPELAESVIKEEKADMVALGRGLLADPYWPIKAREDRTEDIRPCLGCAEGCSARIHAGKPISCAVNPACGRERTYQLVSADKPRKVLIVGGGIAGMEAARVTALRGHRVTLYEKEKCLGGHLVEASVPDFKNDLKRLINWYENQLHTLGVAVKLGTEIFPDLIDKEADVVFVTTGSKPVIPKLPGIEIPKVVTGIDLLLGKKNAGETVVVMGGGLVGCEIALWMTQQKKKVTIVEILPSLMADGIPVPRANKVMLLDLLAMNHVNILTDTRVREINDENVIVVCKNSSIKAIKADTVVLAVGMKARGELYRSLQGKIANVYALGDCQAARNIMRAIWDAYEVARGV